LLSAPRCRPERKCGRRWWLSRLGIFDPVDRERRAAAVNVLRGAGWADTLLAARYHRDFSDGFGLTVYGDFGGCGVPRMSIGR
jgi:hypothetical protein